MKNYEKPTAEIVEFEAVDVVTISIFPLSLITWGSNLKNVDSVLEETTAETALLVPENDTPNFYN